MRSAPVAVLLALGLALAACRSAGPTPGPALQDEAVRLFNDATFGFVPSGSFRADLAGRRDWITKWRGPITASLIDVEAHPAFAALARRTVGELAALAGLSATWHPDGDRSAALRIRLAREREFIINGNERANCFSEPRGAGDGSLAEAEVIVGVDKGGRPLDCLAHELLHAFGFAGHAYRLPTALSSFVTQPELTDWDRLLLRALYDPRLAPGMPREAALPLAREIIGGLLARGGGAYGAAEAPGT